MRPGEQVGTGPWRRAVARATDRDVLVGDQQRADAAAEMVDAALHELGEVVGAIRRTGRLVLRGAEQQLEVAVAHDEVPLQVADAVLRATVRARGTRAPGRSSPCTSVNGRAVAACARLAADYADAAEQRAGVSRSMKT